MAISPIASNQTNASSASTKAANDLNDKYNNFLLLLTKQLQNQDPLSPLDTNQFTQQLVAFSTVEQAIQSNQRLDKLITLQSNTNAYGAVSFIGRQVAYEDDRVALQGGKAQLAYELPQSKTRAILSITDSTGRLVATRLVDPNAGAHRFVWDGTGDDGQTAPDGLYRIAVTAFDDKGETNQAAITGIGKVDGASLKEGNIELFIGNLAISLDKVRQIGAQ